MTFSSRTAVEAIEAGDAKDCDVLVVDPPRKGLDSPVLKALQAPRQSSPVGSVSRLIYVSCGFDALLRELHELTSSGWRISDASGYLMFPGSDHLETVVSLQRSAMRHS